MTESRKLRVFLCHASQDKPIVRELYERLLAEGWIDPWLDEYQLQPGMQYWSEKIEDAIETSDIVIAFLSNNSLSKEGTLQKEIRRALNKSDEMPDDEIFFIPLRIDDCPIPRRISKLYLYQDYSEGNELAYKKLYLSLEKRARKLDIDIKKIKENIINTEKEKQIRAEVEERVRQKEETTIRAKIEKEVREALEEIARKQAFEMLEKEKADELVRMEEERIRKIAEENDIERNKLLINGLEFMKIPAGPYLMGSNEISDANPRHTAQIQYDYWIGRFPITNLEFVDYVINLKLSWSEILREISLGILFFSILKRMRINWLPKFLEDKKNIPVSSLSYIEIIPYIKWLNKYVERDLPKGYRLSLPSEYEWEKAARGINGNIYPWGDNYQPDKCNTKESQIYHTTPVDKFVKLGDSPYGVSDMSGNVWEWTRSIFKDYKEEMLEQNILGQFDTLVLRGGSFKNKKIEAAIAFRRHENPQAKAGYLGGPLGFRVVIIPEKKEMPNSL